MSENSREGGNSIWHQFWVAMNWSGLLCIAGSFVCIGLCFFMVEKMGNKGLLGRNTNYEWDSCTGMWMRRNFCPGSRPIEIPNFALPNTLQCLYQIFWTIHWRSAECSDNGQSLKIRRKKSNWTRILQDHIVLREETNLGKAIPSAFIALSSSPVPVLPAPELTSSVHHDILDHSDRHTNTEQLPHTNPVADL